MKIPSNVLVSLAISGLALTCVLFIPRKMQEFRSEYVEWHDGACRCEDSRCVDAHRSKMASLPSLPIYAIPPWRMGYKDIREQEESAGLDCLERVEQELAQNSK